MLIKKFEHNGLIGKVFKTSTGFYHKIYKGNKQVAQMYYYSHTYEDAVNNMYDVMETIDVDKAEKFYG